MIDFIHNSHELALQRKGKGVQLISSSTQINLQASNELPFNFYLMNRNSELEYANTRCLETMQIDSMTSAAKKTVHCVTSHETALKVIEHDKEVMQQNKILITEEELSRPDCSMRCLTIKYPLYLEQKNIGVFGVSVFFERDSLAASLQRILEMGLLNAEPTAKLYQHFHNQFNLTSREKECLYYAVNGKTAREIAMILELSRRTVEQHLDSIKFKMGVQNRSAMIELGLKLFKN